MILEAKRIKCAHCKDYHGSIAEVKACANVHNAAKVFTAPADPPIDVLLDVGTAPSQAMIEHVKWENIQPGRYALEEESGGRILFYKISKPTEGRWAGRVFVDRQAGDDFYPVKSDRSRRHILDLIAVDPQKAMLRYGEELGVCGICGRTLTDEQSRRDKIGPICRQKFAWWFMGARP